MAESWAVKGYATQKKLSNSTREFCLWVNQTQYIKPTDLVSNLLVEGARIKAPIGWKVSNFTTSVSIHKEGQCAGYRLAFDAVVEIDKDAPLGAARFEIEFPNVATAGKMVGAKSIGSIWGENTVTEFTDPNLSPVINVFGSIKDLARFLLAGSPRANRCSDPDFTGVLWNRMVVRTV